uniref:Small ribosomal subunit protein uS3m n=1 Tax=Chlorokybus atmophyticus TaxID=3144 RepID=A6YEA6_CHLAT|nr:ribosomal protein S3 [Chlorokybus atmophyticus]ABO15121.1 ribosomal protein S3 [Chlorokybus atmophyticus]
MGQKTNPISVRNQLNRAPDSCWYNDYNYANLLFHDLNLRSYYQSLLRLIKLNSGRCILQISPKKVSLVFFYSNNLTYQSKKGTPILPLRGSFLPLRGSFLPLRGSFLPLRGSFLPLRGNFRAAAQIGEKGKEDESNRRGVDGNILPTHRFGQRAGKLSLLVIANKGRITKSESHRHAAEISCNFVGATSSLPLYSKNILLSKNKIGGAYSKVSITQPELPNWILQLQQIQKRAALNWGFLNKSFVTFNRKDIRFTGPGGELKTPLFTKDPLNTLRMWEKVVLTSQEGKEMLHPLLSPQSDKDLLTRPVSAQASFPVVNLSHLLWTTLIARLELKVKENGQEGERLLRYQRSAEVTYSLKTRPFSEVFALLLSQILQNEKKIVSTILPLFMVGNATFGGRSLVSNPPEKRCYQVAPSFLQFTDFTENKEVNLSFPRFAANNKDSLNVINIIFSLLRCLEYTYSPLLKENEKKLQPHIEDIKSLSLVADRSNNLDSISSTLLQRQLLINFLLSQYYFFLKRYNYNWISSFAFALVLNSLLQSLTQSFPEQKKEKQQTTYQNFNTSPTLSSLFTIRDKKNKENLNSNPFQTKVRSTDSNFHLLNRPLQRSQKILNFTNHIKSIISNGTLCHTSIRPVKIKEPFKSAELVAQDIAFKLEKRESFRKISRQIIKDIKRCKYVEGIRITCAGRFNGAEMARVESRRFGQTSLHVFSKKIDYSSKTAYTPYGLFGVKVWISYT